MAKKTNKDFSLDEFIIKFDDFCKEVYKLPTEKLKPCLTVEKLIDLKLLLADINGIITSETEKAFIQRLLSDGIISKETAEATLEKHDARTPYDNGYDIVIDDPWIAAEIKCNIPVEGDRFGAAQANAIKSDINKLFYPERKLKKQESLKKDFIKFMVVLRIGSGFDEAVSKIIKASEKQGIKIELYLPEIELDCDTVYVMIIDKLGDSCNNLSH